MRRSGSAATERRTIGAEVVARIETLRLRCDRKAAYMDAGIDLAWAEIHEQNPTLSPIIVAVIDDGFPRLTLGNSPDEKRYNVFIKKELDNGNIQIHPPAPSAQAPQIDIANLHVMELGAGSASSAHGSSVTSILIADNSIVKDGYEFSGIISSVDGLEFELIFYEVGMEFEHSKVMSPMDLINTLEHIEPYKLQVDVVNMSFTMKCGFHGINIKPIFHNHCRGYLKMKNL